MRKILIIMALVISLLSSNIIDKEKSLIYKTSKICNDEINKDYPNFKIIKKQCYLYARIISKDDYGKASYYYLVSGNFQNVIKLRRDISSKLFIYIFYAYIMRGKFKEAKKIYQEICNDTDMETFKYYYNQLNKIFPNSENLKKSISIWKKICIANKEESSKKLYQQKILCDKEYKKRRPNKKRLKRYCKKAMSYSIGDKDFTKAMFYSLLLEGIDKSVKSPIYFTQTYDITDNQYALLAIWYSLRGKNRKAKMMYENIFRKKSILSRDDIPLNREDYIREADILIRDTLKNLFRIYPNKIKYINKGVSIYAKILLKTQKLEQLLKKFIKEKNKRKKISLINKIEKIMIGLNIVRNNSVYFNRVRARIYTEHNDTKGFNNELSQINLKYSNYRDKYYETIIDIYSEFNQTDKVKSTYQEYINELKSKKDIREFDYQKIADNYVKLKQFKNAIEFYYKSLDELKKDYKNEIFTDSVTSVCSSIAKIYIKLEEFYKVPECYRSNSILIQNENKFGLKLSTYISDTDNCNDVIGTNPKIRCFSSELSILEDILPKAKRQIITYHRVLGDLYNTRYYGSKENALYHYNKSIDAILDLYGKNSELLVSLYHRVGSTYHIFDDDYNKALEFYQKSIQIGHVIGVSEVFLCRNYEAMYEIYSDLNQTILTNKYKAKFNSCKLNDKEKEALESKRLDQVMAAFITLGRETLNIDLDKELAIKYYKNGIESYTKSEGKDSLNVLNGYMGLSRELYNQHLYKKAYSYIIKGLEIYLNNLNFRFIAMSDIQKEQFLSQNLEVFSLYLNIVYSYTKENNSDSKTIKLYQESLNNWLNYKGTISESSNLLSMIYEKADSETKKDIDRLRELSVTLSNLYQNNQKKNTQSIKYIEDEINQLEIKLNKNIKEFREFKNLQNISDKNISKILKDDELYIDFARIDSNYYIFTLNKELDISFNQIDEEDSNKLEESIQLFRKTNSKMTKKIKNIKALKQESKRYLSKIYTILNKYINFKSKKSLIISPDGLLNFLPFEALYDGEKYLVESVNISYIPSGRELVRQSRREKSTNNSKDVVIFGDIDYGLNDDTTSYKKSLNLMHYLPQLTSSKEEIDTLYKLYPKAKIYQDKMATVENLFKIKSPKILHLSTHGKFVDDKNTTNPMQQTILAFSDANYAILEKNYRGIATALKLSSLSLNNTELVFLSACETGLGTIQTAEGVQGLPKAFIQAGAKNIIMSLWQVDDSKTTELTRYFYENIKSGMSYKEALREAKLKMIEMHPYYWSGFVFSGGGT